MTEPLVFHCTALRGRYPNQRLGETVYPLPGSVTEPPEIAVVYGVVAGRAYACRGR